MKATEDAFKRFCRVIGLDLEHWTASAAVLPAGAHQPCSWALSQAGPTARRMTCETLRSSSRAMVRILAIVGVRR